MKIDLTDVSPVRKEMSVEVPAEDVEREKNNLLKSYRSKARIPGFRPGKAPMSVIRDGSYKLVMSLNDGETRLFNLDEDIEEQHDLSARMPEKTQALHRRLLEYLEAVDAEDVEDMRQARRKEVEGYRAHELKKEHPDPERLRQFEDSLRMFEANRLRSRRSRRSKQFRWSHFDAEVGITEATSCRQQSAEDDAPAVS